MTKGNIAVKVCLSTRNQKLRCSVQIILTIVLSVKRY